MAVLLLRKEESRELLTALTRSYGTMVSNPDGLRDQDVFDEAEATALITLSSRIFIAEDVEQYGIFEWWKRAVLEFEAEGDVDKFAQDYSWINAVIVKIATGKNNLPTVIRRVRRIRAVLKRRWKEGA